MDVSSRDVERYRRITSNLLHGSFERGDKEDSGYFAIDDFDQTDSVDAKLVTSRIVDEEGKPTGSHKLVIDLDHDAILLPSSQPGHHHLIVDVTMSDAKLYLLLETLAVAGVIERGYADASIEQKGTSARTPWALKSSALPERRAYGDEFRDQLLAIVHGERHAQT
ncbi:hypothetical protein [Gordonia sp. N1V]|uniref:hypothetical protein n=1 Tax=Gordonia sp. N1V TaxID=3034163 RepID=UPI0023E179D4|nr:hypothetical protein [Gordonia sp. N1V]MDF3280863.1 hypothetical protein [Gordonia sp. N1V]